MASISIEPNGRRRILFVTPEGRKTVRLGKVPLKAAETVKTKIETILERRGLNVPLDADTVSWLRDIDDILAAKLAKAELMAPRGKAAVMTLASFLDDYIASRTKINPKTGKPGTKPNTRKHLERARKDLVDYFRESRDVCSITAGDADSWFMHLIGERGLGPNTARRIAGRAKQFFKFAVRRTLIAENPFSDLKSAVHANAERFVFVSREDSQKVIDACPDAQWRLLFALSRYGGLRCPSEHLALKWDDVDWQNGRIRARSPKAEHHEGKASRLIPMFPELRPYLEEAFELAEPGTEFVITRYRDSNANLRTQLMKIIRRAGLEPWEKPFQNLRSTRETELYETYPLHVVVAWLGNTQAVAAKHYLQVTDEHFQRASESGAQCGAVKSANARNDSQGVQSANAKPRKLRGIASACASRDLTQVLMAPRLGLEPRT